MSLASIFVPDAPRLILRLLGFLGGDGGFQAFVVKKSRLLRE
ncbi:hypothetical protein M2164_000284 [Streptomyces sp. SAI-208]|jgi:hypothetical protein|nr:hypothetical protein [Streptomyces sp. SAI-090]MDH6545976.1 hypothetical protein [Streptomyces sp. SAI-041]MDH6589959.1 hypothetical protein [Streptomyces sp. SAI-133]MDH6604649.1 hypothetical protein [Streptomyces sp. SAI-208]MDH6622117.1 hypothetical protein [Streptomyces sp. SAI-135]